MARPQYRNKKESSRKKTVSPKATGGKPSFEFGDAVLDASRFLSNGSSNNSSRGRGGKEDDEENSGFQFEDEELDSDDALGSDDDLDDYMSKSSKRNTEDDEKLDEYGENEDGWDNVDEGELLTLSEIWDRDDKELNSAKKSSTKAKDHDLVFNDEEDEEDEGEEENSESESDDDDDDDDDDDNDDDDPFDEMNISEDDQNDIQLDSVMKNLKKNLPKDSSDKLRKQLINDNSAENEYSLPNQGDALTFDDMLEDIENLDGEENGGFNNDLIHDIAKHLKQLKELKEAALDEEEQYELNTNENSAFAIPLPINIQKRHDRRAAYEIQKEQVNRWREVIAHNREKKVLKFIPEKIKLDKTAAFKADSNIAVNDFEAKLDSIIDQSNTESKKTEDLFENIETAKLSKAEMLKRTNELRLMRELMYRGMKDSKRLKKIKSKAYRKQMRKEKLKENLLISQANRQEGIEDDDEEDVENDAVYKRARERMTLKHKNTSQWARQMIKSGMSKDKSTRDEMEEMLKQSEHLKLKQLGKKNADDSSEDERNLSDLEKDVDNMDEVDDEKLSKIGKGVLAMDFMKNAEERDRLVKLKEIDFLKKMNSDNSQNYGFQDDQSASGVNITMNSGRRVYTPSARVAAEEALKADQKLMEELDEDDSRSLQNRLSVKERNGVKIVENSEKRTYSDDDNVASGESANNDEENPWLVDHSENDDDSEDDNKSKSSTKLKIIDSSSSKLVKAGARIAKKLSKRKDLLKKERDDDDDTGHDFVGIENKETLQIVDPKKLADNNKAAKSDDEFEDDVDEDDDDNVRIFKQADLIKQAFAGDDVLVEEFEQEKREVEEEEGDKEVNLVVPGWGSWAGTEAGADDGWGVPRNNKKRKIVKTIQGVVSKDKRLDKGKANVIINEKVNKKNTKYQTDKIPYPYKTWEEYERSLRVPLGKEWTTTQTHHKMITPKVITKFGSVIDPLKAPFSE